LPSCRLAFPQHLALHGDLALDRRRRGPYLARYRADASLGRRTTTRIEAPMIWSDAHVASLAPRIRALLARAQGETGLPRLATLATVSQMLREQLDAVDRHLHTLLVRHNETDYLVTDTTPTPADLGDTLADVAAQLDQGETGPQAEP
jgi:hypothetical protein